MGGEGGGKWGGGTQSLHNSEVCTEISTRQSVTWQKEDGGRSRYGAGGVPKTGGMGVLMGFRPCHRRRVLTEITARQYAMTAGRSPWQEAERPRWGAQRGMGVAGAKGKGLQHHYTLSFIAVQDSINQRGGVQQFESKEGRGRGGGG